MEEIFKGDTVGITLDTKIDVSGYGTKQILYRKPSGIEGYWSASISTPTTRITYTTQTTDLDEVGVWAVQAYVTAGGIILHGHWTNFNVLDPTL